MSTQQLLVPITQQSAFLKVQNTKSDSDFFTYQAGLVYKPTENGSIYASFATSANPMLAYWLKVIAVTMHLVQPILLMRLSQKKHVPLKLAQSGTYLIIVLT